MEDSSKNYQGMRRRWSYIAKSNTMHMGKFEIYLDNISRDDFNACLLEQVTIGILRNVKCMITLGINNDMLFELNECLVTAINFSHYDIAKYLIEMGADVHINDDSLIVRCCEQETDNDELLSTLIAAGIDVMKHYKTCIDLCCKHKLHKCGAILVKYSKAYDERHPVQAYTVYVDSLDEPLDPSPSASEEEPKIQTN